jgi:CHAD domain-containing protein
VAQRGRHVGRRSGEELHRLRKSLKKLRYSADYLSGLFGHKSVKAYLKTCKELQELLGQINDAAMAVTLAERLARHGRTDLAGGIGAVAQWADARRQKALHRLPDAWDAFRHASRFWR